MKKTQLLLGAVIFTSMGVLSANVEAATYGKEGKQADTTGTIKLIEDILPTKPNGPNNEDTPIIPGGQPGVNTQVGNFLITYASDLNFGTHVNKGGGITAYAKNDTITQAQKRDADGELMYDADGAEVMIDIAEYNTAAEASNGKYEKLPTKVKPFVGTKDIRPDGESWSLQVSQTTPFTTGTDKKELKGATLTFSGLHYETPTSKETLKPTAKAGEIQLSSDAQDIATAAGDNGKGIWSLSLGNLPADFSENLPSVDTSDITLKVPGNTALDDGTYTSTITYDLVADPAVGA